MKLSRLVAVSLVAGLLCGAAVIAQTALAQSSGGPWNTETATIGEMTDNAAAKAVFQKHFPEILANPQSAQARDFTLPEIRQFVPSITRAKLNAMDADLRALPPRPITAAPEPPPVNEWLTWGYDPERSGWNRAETTLSTRNASRLRNVWSTQLSTPTELNTLSTVTAPVIVAGVDVGGVRRDLLFIHGRDDTLFALDANDGRIVWQKTYKNDVPATKPPDWQCSNTPQATPTIDKARGLVFFISGDGKLRAANLADGAERMTPTEFTSPFARSWSLNLIDNVVYATSGRACAEVVNKDSPMYAAALSGIRRLGKGPLRDASAVNAMDVKDLQNPKATYFFTSGARPAAPWGRGGLARGPGNSVILETSNGRWDPMRGDFSESILRLAPKAVRLMDSFVPSNYAHNLRMDLSGSASPVVFEFNGRTLVAATQKEGVLRLLDANNLGGDDHHTPLWASPRLGNDEETGTDPGRGVWGAITTAKTPDGRRFLYLPMHGGNGKAAPPFAVNQGATPNGSIMAFEVVEKDGKISAEPRWQSGDMIMPDPPVVANGVLYATQTGGQPMQNFLKPGDKRMQISESNVMRATPTGNLRLFAFDAVTGKQLYDSKNTLTNWVHFSEPVVALGKVYLVTHDAKVHAFGLKK
ncbi:MAG TPA: PQQ-binding-like beta-propeller repeat protein [Rhizomicrobium sp.]|nr:PQQ-binding-like beta-propeller repeat protein [Rhizomicrobium sp.]